MKKRGKVTATLLSLAIFASSMNVFGYTEGQVSEVESHTENLTVVTDTISTTSGSSVGLTTEEVIYNTGEYNVTVVSDELKSTTDSTTHKVFDDNNSYVINVENNAFFPYEVQFTYDGEVFTKWFDTMESSVEIGEYTFYINSIYTDLTKLSSLGVWIGDDYVAVKPEEKTFNNLSYSTRTLLPIKTVDTTLDLSDYHTLDLKDIKISAVVGGIISEEEFQENDVILYSKSIYTDEFAPLSEDDTFDFSDFQLIVGSGKQLDLNNTKYNVRVNLTKDKEIFIPNVVKVKDGIKSELNVIRADISIRKNTNYLYQYNYNYVNVSEFDADEFQVSFDINLPEGATYEIYDGYFTTIEDAEAGRKISTDIVDIDLYYQDGYTIEKRINDYSANSFFTMVVDYNGQKTLVREYFRISYDFNIYFGKLRKIDGSEVSTNEMEFYDNGEKVIYITVENDVVEDEYKVLLSHYKYNAGQNYIGIEGAFVGDYNTLEDAQKNAKDIKSELFYYSGYKSNYSDNGVLFSIFDSNNAVFKYRVIVKNDSITVTESSLPNPGNSDLNFAITRLYGESVDSYILPYKHDTYYDMGYQTLFIQDKDYDLSTMKLQYSTYKGVKVYSGHNGSAGVLQHSGESIQDFEKDPVQYAVTLADGSELKNYWVTAVKQQSGPSIFVNGINGDDGRVREVYLTSRHDYVHDIFIANIGDEDITNLNVELVDGKNIKLDDYWTIGGENNNVLGAFTAENTSTANGMYLDKVMNAGKIRLKAIDENGGEISGMLKITGDGIEPVEIILKGNAGNPTFKTTEIPDGVKYVPYAVQLMQNNKYYWNKVTFEITSGRLPSGLELKENGEIYGVPKETGAFSVGFKLDNSDPKFSDSYRTFDFEIVENTNENVTYSTDVGYELEEVFGTVQDDENVVNIDTDELFHSAGGFAEFQDFWLNGEKLVKGVDYIAEEGSTKITVKKQTLKDKALTTSKNTIAAEFRVNGDVNNELKRTAQNFITSTTSGEGNNNGGSSGGGSNYKDDGYVSESKSKVKEDIIKVVEPQIIIGSTGQVKQVMNLEAFVLDNIWRAIIDVDRMNETLDIDYSLDKKYTVVVELANIDAGAEKFNFTITKEALEAIGNKDNVSLSINLGGVFTLTLDPNAIESLIKYGTDIDIKVEKDDEGVLFEFYSNNTLISTVDGVIKIALYNIATGEVIVLVEKNGIENLIKKSSINDKDVFAIINGSGKVKVVDKSKKFDDVDENAWYSKVVKDVNSRSLLIGVSENKFAPKIAMSRAMIATLLFRLEDGSEIDTVNTFKDVSDNKWYSKSVEWSASIGLINGTGAGKFDPEKNVTREQLAVILYNYAQYLGMDTKARGDLTQFADYDKISSWAKDAVRWSVASGLLKGDGENINSNSDATRAEVSALIMRFIDLMVK